MLRQRVVLYYVALCEQKDAAGILSECTVANAGVIHRELENKGKTRG